MSRLPFLAMAVVSLLAGMLAGLWRAGWQTPFPHSALFNWHGPLMISGFLGTLISLERAVAYGRPWGYAVAAISGLSGLFILFDETAPFAPLLAVAAAGGYNLFALLFFMKVPSLHMAVMGLGAVSWLAGNVLWLANVPTPQITLWWANFLVFTIAGERLELSRLLQPGKFARTVFILGVVIGAAGAPLALTGTGASGKLVGIAYMILAGWLLANDMARKLLKQKDLQLFIGVALIAGFIWLGIGGLLFLLTGEATAGFRYDAMLHALFLGFVFSMIFAHGPIIFPALLKRSVEFHWIFYLHFAILQGSLVLRLVGDAMLSHPVRIYGSLLNVLAILLFFVNTAMSIHRTK